MRYSNDLRKRAVDLLESGKTVPEVSEILNIAKDTLYLWRKKLKSDTLYDIIKTGGHPVMYDLEGLKKFVENHPDKYIREIKNEFFEKNGKKASFGGIHKALKRMDFRLKKKSSYSEKGIRKTD
jgi:transposase